MPEQIADVFEPKQVDFFGTDRGERELYANCGVDEEVVMPVTRDGFEAFIERCVNQFTPALPHDDSIRKVFAGYIHHIENEHNTVTVRQISKVLYKSIANAMTWTVDQEVKAKLQRENNERLMKAKMVADEQARAAAEAKRESKLAKKGRRVTVTSKPNEK